MTEYAYTLTRTFDVPAQVVWEAWTTPHQYEQWASAVPGSVTMDVREGGAWQATMLIPDAGPFPMSGSYREVVPGERLTLTMDIPGAAPAAMTLTLSEVDGRAHATVSQVLATAEERDMAEEGSGMLMDGLAAFLA
ncbi:SRPBCC family protein [Longispora albida]|uniref:SRPBCC family protein n=1 Tax=Longispora albida TaxID=203523 RepID=UPI000373FB7C|nr:SRPBCC domain-containing protein [Longispora albida]